MARPVSIPLQTTPLLANSEERDYSTIRPKLRLIIPPSQVSSDEITTEDNLVVTIDEEGYDGDISGSHTTCSETGQCEHCMELGLNHTLQAYHQQRYQEPRTETQTACTAVRIFIWFCLYLIGIVVLLMLPAFIFLVLRAYTDSRLDRTYPDHPRWSIQGIGL
ncbi:hypothetical protein F5Y14DRAFT_447027 [Nemania sp. NC0429]|nr:hypothetical protein F5Y14DRAFT_447027 [Nemania sp. NC0429]